MSYKLFRERLEEGLNIIGLPKSYEERVRAFSKVFGLSRHTSSSILNGIIIPDNQTLQIIAEELDVTTDWLLGKSNTKK